MLASYRNDPPPRHLFSRAVAWTEEFVMSIQDYAQSIAATGVVSKTQLFRFLEMQFARADKNHDGLLNVDELAVFVQFVSSPESDQR
jgi:hypothetical protein